MFVFVRLLIALTILAGPPAAHADISNQELMAVCAEKTVLFRRQEGKLVQTGEKLDGYCAGYLQAALDVLRSATFCKSSSEDPDLLLATYLQYAKDQQASPSASASATLIHAFRRFTRCS